MGLAGCGTKETPATVAEKYPDRPITLIVPFAAGGTTDMVARAMERVAYKHLGQNLMIKNVTGAGGSLGWNELVESNDDGYTLGIVVTSVLLQSLYEQSRYHYTSALDPLVQIMDVPPVVVVRADKSWKDMTELIKHAKEHPSDIKLGHQGLGTGNHVAGERINRKVGINVPQVPFKGDSEVVAALLGDHVQYIIVPPPVIKEYVKSGMVKVLGTTAMKRMTDPVFSNAPTLQEQGIDVVFSSWYGIAVHKGLPPEIKAKLLAGLEKTVNDPEYIENMKKLGMEVDYLGHEEFFKKWLVDARQLKEVVKESGITEKIAAQKK
ncbi:tripartite tricarboxylate transporter substrate binding protein|nr:tripartite tricarboxylate transporter substrate binding protein [Dendrosporobacter quercicolus]NSL46602.1 tripartite tricarboxylate transporter substrate binding protein [Dendrosporobacter quercicolus DSM 1736]